MTSLRRAAGLLPLLALIIIIIPFSVAQEEDTTIRVVGSAIVQPLFDALIAASETPIELTTDIRGTSAGFQAFCAREADVVLATRPINGDEDANCLSQEVAYIELLLGTYNVALVGSPSLDFATCLSIDEITRLFGPSASGVTNNWRDINAEFPDESITIFLPPINTLAYNILDGQLVGDGLRSDAIILDDHAAIAEQVADSSGGIGVLDYETALAQSDRLLLIDVNSASDGCVTPSSDNVESNRYPFGSRLFVYVNNAIRQNLDVETLLNFIVGQSAIDTIVSAGFTPPSVSSMSANQAVLAGEENRILTAEAASYDIPLEVSGQVAIGGGALGESYVRSVLNSFTSIYANVTSDLRFEGVVAGVRRLCNGELDAVITYSALDATQEENCASNNINTLLFPVGAQAVVLVANAEDGFAACLTTNHVYTIWRAESDGVVENWSDLDPAFPQQAMTLFGLTESGGQLESDLLFTGIEGSIPPVRVDTEHDFDPLYRAAAVANVPGALTYMSWNDYERVLANGQQNIQLVAINGGAGCIEPNEQSIRDGSYPLSRRLFLVVNQNQLTQTALQSVLWFLYDDENVVRLSSLGFLPFDSDELFAIRNDLVEAYRMAEQTAAEALPEATAIAPDAEVTPEAGD